RTYRRPEAYVPRGAVEEDADEGRSVRCRLGGATASADRLRGGGVPRSGCGRDFAGGSGAGLGLDEAGAAVYSGWGRTGYHFWATSTHGRFLGRHLLKAGNQVVRLLTFELPRLTVAAPAGRRQAARTPTGAPDP